MPERDHILWPHTGRCLTVHRDAYARALRVQTPLNMGVWHAICFHAEFFNVVRRVAIRMACVAACGARKCSAVPTVTIYYAAQMAGLAGIVRCHPYYIAAQLVLE